MATWWSAAWSSKRGETRPRRCEGHARRKATRIVIALSLLRGGGGPCSFLGAGLPMNGIPTASRLVHCRSPTFPNTFDQSGLLLNAAQLLSLAICRHLAPGRSEPATLEPRDFDRSFLISLSFSSHSFDCNSFTFLFSFFFFCFFYSLLVVCFIKCVVIYNGSYFFQLSFFSFDLFFFILFVLKFTQRLIRFFSIIFYYNN